MAPHGPPPPPTPTTETTTTTRFPPEPSFPIDLGHVKAALCVDAFARRQNPHAGNSWILRFDDTNPRACAAGGGGGRGRVAASVASYLRELPAILPPRHLPSRVTFASDYFLDMQRAAEALIRHGLAYVDEDPPDLLRVRRLRGEASPWRGRPVLASLDAWLKMQRGEPCDNSGACSCSSSPFFGVLRLALPDGAPDHPNAAMRDPVAFRVVAPPPPPPPQGAGAGAETGGCLHWRWDARERALLARLCPAPDDDATGDAETKAAAEEAEEEEDDDEDDAPFERRRPRAIPLPVPPSWLAPLYAAAAAAAGGRCGDSAAAPVLPPPPPPPPFVYPTYDFACPFLDLRERCAYALRTREFRDRDAQHASVQALVLEAARLEREGEGGCGRWPAWLVGGEEEDEGGGAARKQQQQPAPPQPTAVLEFSKILFPGVPLDKPSLRAIAALHGGSSKSKSNNPTMLDGGPTDPRLPTLAGLLRAGCDARALRRVLLEQALPEGREAPKGAAGGAWSKLWSVNRSYVGRRAPRHMAVLEEEEGEGSVVVVELVSPSSAPKDGGNGGGRAQPEAPPLAYRTAPLPKGGHSLRVLDRPREVRLSRADAEALLSSASSSSPHPSSQHGQGPMMTLLGLGAARLLPSASSTGGPPRRLRAELLLDAPQDGASGSGGASGGRGDGEEERQRQRQQQEEQEAAAERAAKAAPLKFGWVPGPCYDRVAASTPIRVLYFSSPYPRHLAAGRPVLARAAPSPSLAAAAAAAGAAGAAALGGGRATPTTSPSSLPPQLPLFFDGPDAIARAFGADGPPPSRREARGRADAALAELAARADAEGRCWGSDARLALARAGGWGAGGGAGGGGGEEEEAGARPQTPQTPPPPHLPLAPPPAPAVVQFLRLGNFVVDRVDYDDRGAVALVTLIAIPDGREAAWHAPAATKTKG